jgi:hypothetical protein
MTTSLSLAVTLLTTALSLLTMVQQNPDLPQDSKDNARQMAETAIAQATNIISTSNTDVSSSSDTYTELELSLIEISKTPNSAQISWETNFPVDSKIVVTEVPVSDNLDTSQYLPSANGVSTQGIVSIVGLKENTQYHYAIEATMNGDIVVIEGEFTTDKSAELIAQEALAIENQAKSERIAEIQEELNEIDCKQMGCFISVESLERFNALNKELSELGGSHFGCSFAIKGGGRARCEGIGG